MVISREELLTRAREVAQRAYCRYSHFHVGAAVVAGNNIYVGVNIELSSYGLTICAERSALAAAISDGAGKVTQIAVACVDAPPDESTNWRTPCGACRQWIAELAPDAIIHIDGLLSDCTISDLMQLPFGPTDGRVDTAQFSISNRSRIS